MTPSQCSHQVHSLPAHSFRWAWVCTNALLIVLGPVLLSGCASNRVHQWDKTVNNDTCEIDAISQQIDNPGPHLIQTVAMTSQPVTALSVSEDEVSYRDMTLDEVLRLAMQNSTILRDIGGVVLRAPDTLKSGYTTGLQETDPRFGMEAALSAFDAQLNGSATFNNNDRIFNNAFFAGGATAFTQDLHDYQVELSKRVANGSLLAIRGVSNYDANNAPANTFRSSWDTWLEGEIRQPLLQGGGLEFNRIAGPGSSPGIYNGVLIAKVNSDINHADFMAALRDYVSNVENAYWDLYMSYRELDARKKAMEKALVVWNEAIARKESGASASFDIAEEALARQQYYLLKAEVDEALSGRLLQGTQTQNGSGGGTLQLTGGVLTAERRLRLLIGTSTGDGELIRTVDEPTMANIAFDWQACVAEAIKQRPELQRQHLNLKKREMELLAARNFLNPRLDAVGRYRWRGFGDDLIGSGNQGGNSPASAVGNLATGDQQEWSLGLEFTIPIGYRRANAAVQHAELAVSRERAIQREQQREVESNLGGAIADAVRAYQSVENNLNQYLAAKDYVKTLETRRDAQQSDGADRILDGHRRLVQAEIRFFRARSEYAVALKNVHYEKGSLLRYKDLIVQGESNDLQFAVPPATEERIIPAQPFESPVEVSDSVQDSGALNTPAGGEPSSAPTLNEQASADRVVQVQHSGSPQENSASDTSAVISMVNQTPEARLASGPVSGDVSTEAELNSTEAKTVSMESDNAAPNATLGERFQDRLKQGWTSRPSLPDSPQQINWRLRSRDK